MGQPHKHAELIKAWADGAQIQYRENHTDEWKTTSIPIWSIRCHYRIKPEPKPDVIYVANIVKYSNRCTPVINACYQDSKPSSSTEGMNVRLIFDGEAGNLKAVEIIND